MLHGRARQRWGEEHDDSRHDRGQRHGGKQRFGMVGRDDAGRFRRRRAAELEAAVDGQDEGSAESIP